MLLYILYSINLVINCVLQRSALAYHQNDSSLEGGLNRMNVGISTTSTTSRSSKSSQGCVSECYNLAY